MHKENFKGKLLNKLLKENQTDLKLSFQSVWFSKIIESIYHYHYLNLSDSDRSLRMNLEDPELMRYGLSEEYFRLYLQHLAILRIGEYCKRS